MKVMILTGLVLISCFLIAGCGPQIMAPRIPEMKYGEKAPFGPETTAPAVPIKEESEESPYIK